MSCLGPSYNPIPAKLWYRYENRCAYNTILPPQTNQEIYIPLLRKTVPRGSVDYELAMLYKGNILQYKKNSANITKSQRYSQIAQGKWTNNTTTWATQTQSSTSPNTKSLQRVNYTNVTVINGIPTPTSEPLTCPFPIFPIFNNLPAAGTTGSSGPIIPPPPPTPPQPPGPVIPPIIIPPAPPAPIVIPSGGTLICNVTENICTGEIYSVTGNQQCYPTSDSDVPGPIIYLCYNDGLPVNYPRTRLTYATSGNKFPVNNKIWGTTDNPN